MVKITKVYTCSGDRGDTGLVDGTRVPKDSLRVEAYGTLDELNAVLGLARTWNERGRQDRAARWVEGVLRKLQDELFDLGSELATPAGFTHPGQFKVGKKEIKALEKLIDKCTAEMDPLLSFILPGGGPVTGFLHQARTIGRRAERVVVKLMREEPAVGSGPLTYLNRLSDLLFVLSRWVSKHRGETEYLWKRGLLSHEKKRDQMRGRGRTRKTPSKKSGRKAGSGKGKR